MAKTLKEENSRAILTIYGENDTSEARKFPQYLAAGLATLGAFAAGTCLSWTSPALPLLLSEESPVSGISPHQASWIGSLLTLGAVAGAIPSGKLAERFGRKRLILCTAIPLFMSWILIAFSKCVWGLYASRILAGLAVGAICVATPMYVGELAEPKVRGTLGSFFQLQITLGILFTFIAGMINNFQYLAYILATVPIVFFVLFSFMPESPVYLSKSNKQTEARRALQFFRGQRYDINDEMTQIRERIREDNETTFSLGDLIQSKATIKAMIISLGLMVFQQLSGINAVIFYTASIFNASGSSLSPEMCTIVVGVVQVIATYISTVLMDRAGRRVLLLISDFIMAVCLLTLASFFYLQTCFDVTNYSWIPLVSLAVFIVVFSLGFGPIPWLILGEIFPSNIKGPASSIAASFNWILAFTVTKLFSTMVMCMGSALTFATFGIVCVIGTIFVLTVVPETKGKDLEEIQRELERKDDSDSLDCVEIKKTSH